MGKASFGNMQNLNGNIQIYVARDSIGEEPYAAFKKFDIGDIVGVKGSVPYTEGRDVNSCAEITLLTKALQVLPEKFHGLTDTEIRYRQRYLDLIMNHEVKTTFIKRSQIIKEIRNFLDGRDFMEVETPMLVQMQAVPQQDHSRHITMRLTRMLSFVFPLSFTLRDLSSVDLREYMRSEEYSVTRVLIHVIILSSHLWSFIRHTQITRA